MKTDKLVFRSNQRDIASQLSVVLEGKTQKNENWSCIALLKPINCFYKFPRLKITSNFKEQTRILLELTIEKIRCRQKGASLSNSCKFQSMQIWIQKKLYSNENFRNQPIRGQITFGIQLQTFPWHWNTKNFNRKPETQIKELIPKTEENIPNSTMK